MSETLVVCEHGIPVKFNLCVKCNPDLDKKRDECSHQFSIALLCDRVSSMVGEIADLKHRLSYYENVMVHIGRIKLDAEEAIAIFVKKAHELKQIDAKRDDVINLLNQKITALEQKRS